MSVLKLNTLVWPRLLICTFKTWSVSCADPEIFMRGGPTKMVIFGPRRGGGPNPQKFPKLPFLGKNFKFQGGGGADPRSPPPSGSAHASCEEKRR